MPEPWPFLTAYNLTDPENQTANNTTYPPLVPNHPQFRYGPAVTTFICVAYSAIAVVGLVGNYLVVSVYLRSKHMRGPTNILIVNLACADLLVNALCLPFTLISNIVDAWVLGWFICKTVPYLQGVSVSASVYTLVVISLERCLAICYPMTWQMTSKACKRVVLVIWVFSLVVTSPWVVYFQLLPVEEGSEVQVCTELWPNHQTGNAYFVFAHLLMCYLLPLAVICVCYQLIWRRVSQRTLLGEGHQRGGRLQLMIHRSKVKVVKMLFYVIALFAFSWLPLYGIVCRLKFGGPLSSPHEEEVVSALVPIAQWLGAANSCINPIVYAFLNSKFRAGFGAIASSRSCCSTLHYGADSWRGDTVYGFDTRGSTMRGLIGHPGAPGASATPGKRVTISTTNGRRRQRRPSAALVTRTRSVNVNLSGLNGRRDGAERFKLYGSLEEIGVRV